MRRHGIITIRHPGQYCEDCGKRGKEHWLGIYDTTTGEKVTRMACFNPECRRGKENLCVQSGGHHYKFSSSECECGYDWIRDMI